MVATILNFESNEIYIIEVPKELEEKDGCQIIEELGFKLSSVDYMISENTPSLTINTEALKTF